MLELQIIVGSTRPGRIGLSVARWFEAAARAHGKFNVRLVDLAEVGLPLLDEPKHPRLGQYEKEHTKRWSAIVSAADAFVFVTPEYNFSLAPSLANAIDYLFHEWSYKPVGFVSYGGGSGGLRAVQASKPLVTTLKMMPIPEGVAIPFVMKHKREDGSIAPPEEVTKSVAPMLDELHRWAEALRPLRR